MAYASELQIAASETGDKVAATVEAMSPEADLAVLKLEDDSFFDSHPPLKRSLKLPQIKDSITTYGFPTGGAKMTATAGAVSGIDFTPSSFGASGLRIQLDVPINPAATGGPAVADGLMVGLSFASQNKADRSSSISPAKTSNCSLNRSPAAPTTAAQAWMSSSRTSNSPHSVPSSEWTNPFMVW